MVIVKVGVVIVKVGVVTVKVGVVIVKVGVVIVKPSNGILRSVFWNDFVLAATFESL